MSGIARAWLLAGLAIGAMGCERSVATLGFWFEEVTFESPVLGGRLSADACA